jgi:methylmalonyl-CoA mutase
MEQQLTFPDTDRASYEVWKKRVLKELGELPFETLIRTNSEDLVIQPGYTHDQHGPVLDIPESDIPFLFRNPSGEWELRVDVKGETASLNAQIIDALEGGASGIGFRADGFDEAAFAQVLKGVFADIIAIHLHFTAFPQHEMRAFESAIRALGFDPARIAGTVSFPFAGDLTVASLNGLRGAFSRMRFLVMDVAAHREAGASAAQEVGIALAQANELAHQLTSEGMSADELSGLFAFRFGAGTDYFTEIAKYRAFRFLWLRVIRAYEPTASCAGHAWVYAHAAGSSHAAADPHTNLLRLTTEAMSAVLGGVNGLSLAGCDPADSIPSAMRWSRNIQHLLHHESALNEAVDAARGSWFLETHTAALAHAAWDFFLDVEARGGYRKAMTHTDEVLAQRKKQVDEQIADGKRVVVGYNKYQKKG